MDEELFYIEFKIERLNIAIEKLEIEQPFYTSRIGQQWIKNELRELKKERELVSNIMFYIALSQSKNRP